MKHTSMSSSYIGKVLDNYRIIENLGIGGMGFVFKAVHIKLDKIFALKMIAPSLAMNKEFTKRFETEARALAKLDDPNIVRIYDLRSDNDQWFIVMEYIDGINLMERIRSEGAVKWQKALPIFKQVLAGIGHAHSVGIIHRDIKPNNIMITGEGVVKITDFGLAKDQSGRVTTLSVTSGGTLYFMSPEHVKGISYTDKRSDIYSIGMTFYESLAGHVPFKNLESDFEIRETIMRKELVKPSTFNQGIPGFLEDIIMKALAKNPDERFQTGGEMLEAIEEFEEKIPVLELGEELLADTSHILKKKPFSEKAEGPDTRFEKVLKQQSRDFLRRYSLIFFIFLVIILFITTYLIVSKPISSRSQRNRTTFTIKSNPDGAAVYIDEVAAGHTPLNEYFIQSGKHHFRFEKQGFRTVDTLIWSAEDERIIFNIDLKPDLIQRETSLPAENRAALPGAAPDTSLLIDSNPAGAQIWINDILRGKTPLRIRRFEEKTWKIRIEKDGYLPFLKSYSDQENNISKIYAKLSFISGHLKIISTPAEATITIDGTPVPDQYTPALVSRLPAGQHQIRISKPGYHAQTREVRISRDKTSEVAFNLLPVLGKLAVQVRPWGSVYLDNELQKATSDVRYELSLPVNRYELKVIHPTLGRWVKMITVEADKEVNITVDFSRTYLIRISAADEAGNFIQAPVFIDDKNANKNTPADVTLHTGIHQISVRKEGYIAVNGDQEVFIDSEGIKSYKFVLKKID